MAEEGGCDSRLLNIILVGFAFMFLFTAFQTAGMSETAVLKSARKDSNGTFTGDGSISLGVIYAVFAAANWIAPPIVSAVGPKYTMFIGAILYFLFILSFLKPMTWALYLGSVLVGIGAAILWTAQGNFLTINSDSNTVSRNSGIFWALLQCSLLIGNIYSYFVLKGRENIDDDERFKLFAGLSGAALVGVLLFLTLRSRRNTDSENLINLNSRFVLNIVKYIAILCSFLLGFGDSSFNTQIYSILGFMFPEDSSPAFALFKFVQSVTAAVSFYYSTHLLLQWQLLILAILAVLGTWCFCLIEWSATKAFREGYQSIG
ncbi:UNC93-like protein MFSD11 [Argopecten irradians]|uniref:UNC93-like protein MFSD11 n=1 Tax=Argopecten irradians TaxID=31199 RepID=UPI00371F1EA1